MHSLRLCLVRKRNIARETSLQNIVKTCDIHVNYMEINFISSPRLESLLKSPISNEKQIKSRQICDCIRVSSAPALILTDTLLLSFKSKIVIRKKAIDASHTAIRERARYDSRNNGKIGLIENAH